MSLLSIQSNSIKILLPLVFILALGFVSPVFAASSSSSSILLPDSPLYFLKSSTEWFRRATSLTPQQKFNTELSISNERILEVKELSKRGQADLAIKQLQQYNQVIEQVVSMGKSLIQGGDTQTAGQLSLVVEAQHRDLQLVAQDPTLKSNTEVLDQSLFIGSWSKSELIKTKPNNSAAPKLPVPASGSAEPTSLSSALAASDSISLASETVPDGTVVKAGLKFTKSWTIKNSGSITWKGYSLRFVKGTSISRTSRVDFTPKEIVTPGGTRVFSVDMTAPTNPGSYYSGWQVFNNKEGTVGGIVFVNIVVPAPPPPPKPVAPPPSQAAISTPAPTKSVQAQAWIKLPILMYHYIRVVDRAKDPLGYALSVSPSDFDQQMNYIQTQGYHSVTLGDLYKAIKLGNPLPSRPVIVTFDDGYSDFYTAAFPILKKYNLIGVSYIATGLLGNPAYMTWDQVLAIKQGGMEVESHTVHHIDLSKASAVTIQNEVTLSKKDLESHLGIPIQHFAYPYGGLNDLVINLVAQAGYLTATTTYSGSLHNQSTLLTLRRVRVSGGESLGTFAAGLK